MSESTEKPGPVLYLNGRSELQTSGVTLGDIRVSFPTAYLVNRSSRVAHRDSSFVLQDETDYDCIIPDPVRLPSGCVAPGKWPGATCGQSCIDKSQLCDDHTCPKCKEQKPQGQPFCARHTVAIAATLVARAAVVQPPGLPPPTSQQRPPSPRALPQQAGTVSPPPSRWASPPRQSVSSRLHESSLGSSRLHESQLGYGYLSGFGYACEAEGDETVFRYPAPGGLSGGGISSGAGISSGGGMSSGGLSSAAAVSDAYDPLGSRLMVGTVTTTYYDSFGSYRYLHGMAPVTTSYGEAPSLLHQSFYTAAGVPSTHLTRPPSVPSLPRYHSGGHSSAPPQSGLLGAADGAAASGQGVAAKADDGLGGGGGGGGGSSGTTVLASTTSASPPVPYGFSTPRAWDTTGTQSSTQWMAVPTSLPSMQYNVPSMPLFMPSSRRKVRRKRRKERHKT